MGKQIRDIGRVLFARTGWMTFYAGPQKDDERPIGGGRYNKANVGHEQYNFLDVQGRLYGYFQPAMQTTSVNLRRLGATPGSSSLDGVLVIWVAKGTVVGWYDGAVLFPEPQEPTGATKRMRNGFRYFCTAPTSKAVLLPTANRCERIPQGIPGGMGRVNVRYPRALDGSPAAEKWMADVINWIRDYKGANLLVDRDVEADDAIQDQIFKVRARARAQGWGGTPAERKAVETLAMRRAQKHFEREKYRVKVVGKPYDLECKKAGKTLYVEVKGTTTVGEGVFLTKNEVQFARKNKGNVALYVLDSVILQRGGPKPKVSGGNVRIYYPWQFNDRDLTPVAYTLALVDILKS